MFSFDEAYAAGSDDDLGVVEYGIGDIQEQLNRVDAFMAIVNQDVIKHTSETKLPKMQAVWDNEVWQPWQKFYKSTKGLLGTGMMLRDSTYKRAEAFRQLGLRFRENLIAKERTGTQVTPTPIPPPIHKPDGFSLQPGPGVSLPQKKMDGGFPWKWLLIGGGLAAGGYFAYKYWPRPTKMLAAPEEQIRNPPPWVIDSDLWESAKLAITPYKGRYHNPDAVVTHIYKQMGGRIG